jgi:hypothetical protein
LLDAICVALLPVAVAPLWQLKQPEVTPAWLNTALAQVPVTWQFSHWLSVGMWAACLPPAATPLWQLKQFPLTPLWSNTAPVQVLVLWQVSH